MTLYEVIAIENDLGRFEYGINTWCSIIGIFKNKKEAEMVAEATKNNYMKKNINDDSDYSCKMIIKNINIDENYSDTPIFIDRCTYIE